MTNNITFTIGDKPAELLSATITTDQDSYYWQANITVPPASYALIDQNSKEPILLKITINGTAWAFILEDVKDNRQFIGYTYTLTGRSITALLSSDYATFKNGLNDTLYARQIADTALEYTDYHIEKWNIPDWLIPENTYAYSGKTPIGIIADIAQATGAMLQSHRTDKTFSLIPKWKIPAWELANTTPDVSVPASVIVSISGEKQTTSRANVVYLNGNEGSGKGACVYRQGEAQNSLASNIANALYTDLAPMRAAGIAALSQTGKHKTETVKLPWMQKYNIRLAELGELWQIKEIGDTWQGRITGINISVALENDAPTVWQTLTIDRYLDE